MTEYLVTSIEPELIKRCFSLAQIYSVQQQQLQKHTTTMSHDETQDN